MNILLAFKVEPDLSMLTEADWRAAAKSNQPPDPSLMRKIMGNDEQGAAELMLLTRDGDPTLHLSAITLGDESATPMLRYLAAVGFERLVRLAYQKDTRFIPALVAEQIAHYVAQHPVDLIVLGRQSSEGQNGQTGWLLAEMLGWPCLTAVTTLVSWSLGFDVQCECIDVHQHWRLEQPAVLVVQNRGQMALRVPTMRARLAAAKADLSCITANITEEAPVQCQSLVRQPYRRAGIIIEGKSVQEKAQRLWHDYLALRMR